MNGYASSTWTELVKAAAASPLGIVALVALILGFVGLVWFRHTDSPMVRLIAFGMLILTCGGLAGAAVYRVEPTIVNPDAVEPVRNAGDDEGDEDPRIPGARPAKWKFPTDQVVRDEIRIASTRAASDPVRDPADTEQPRPDSPMCGPAKTVWMASGSRPGDPCPARCVAAGEISRTLRVTGFPPKPQVRYEFQCKPE